MKISGLKVIGFDADDTLWVNETYYRAAEHSYADLLSEFAAKEEVFQSLFKKEMSNLELYGYGIKAFVLSMIENAIEISKGKVSPKIIESIAELGKEMLQKDIELLPGVKEVLVELHGKYKLIVATKGDLLDQERKLFHSSLSKYFHHIEIMSDKTREHYVRLLAHLEIKPEEFIMIGNSQKSDVLPPLEIGCHAIHVPYSTTWEHEKLEIDPGKYPKFTQTQQLNEVLALLI